MKKQQIRKYERYDIERSPLAQKPTQRDLANLLGTTRDELRRIANYKETCIVRRTIEKRGKERELAYPEGPLRVIHEKLKFHLNKIKQPAYLYSPRVGRGQRDNAALHVDNTQYLSVDIKKFYPSVTRQMVKTWLIDSLGMYDDVAGLIAQLATVDDVVSFGSPLTPVLVSLVMRDLFDEIENRCTELGLNFSVWVDDLTISGDFVPGELLTEIRTLIQRYGHRSHKIKFKTGNRAVFITGIGVVGAHLVAPQSLHRRIKDLWDDYHSSKTNEEIEIVTTQLLSQLGTLRHIVGSKSAQGQKASNQMHSLRQKRDKLRLKQTAVSVAHEPERSDNYAASSGEEVVPW